MTLARVLVISSLLLCGSAFAQTSATAPENSFTTHDGWNVAGLTASSKAAETPLDRVHIDEFKSQRDYSRFKTEAKNDPIKLDLNDTGAPDVDGLCYTMRSYVVARDNKRSDSTHPVSYSTCQKASRYRLYTTGPSVVTPTR